MPADEAFAAFYERHYKMVYRICLVYLKNTADAEDCTEDVFVKVLTGGFRFKTRHTNGLGSASQPSISAKTV